MSFVKIFGYIACNKEGVCSQFYDKGFDSYSPNMFVPLNPSLPIHHCTTTRKLFTILQDPDDHVLYAACVGIHDTLLKLYPKIICHHGFTTNYESIEKGEDTCSFFEWELNKVPCPLAEKFSSFYVIPYVPTPLIDFTHVYSPNNGHFEATLFWCIIHPDENIRIEKMLDTKNNTEKKKQKRELE